jgi:hypothetical protein
VKSSSGSEPLTGIQSRLFHDETPTDAVVMHHELYVYISMVRVPVVIRHSLSFFVVHTSSFTCTISPNIVKIFCILLTICLLIENFEKSAFPSPLEYVKATANAKADQVCSSLSTVCLQSHISTHYNGVPSISY